MISIVHRWRVLAVGVMFVALALKFWALFRVNVHIDSNYYLNIGSNFIARWQVTPYMWRLGETNIIAGSGTGYAVYLLGYWFQWVGLTLTAGRVLMYLVGLLTLPLYYAAVRLLWGRDVALAAVTFTTANYMFFWQFNLRMDAFGTLAYTLALLAFALARNHPKHWPHFMVGVLAIASAEFHILGVVWVGMFFITYVLDAVRSRTCLLPLVYYCVGAGASGVIYLAVHVLPDPQAYFFIATEFGPEISPLIREFARYGFFAIYMSLEFVLLVAALIAAGLRRGQGDGLFITLMLAHLIVLAVVGPPYGLHYTTQMWPLLGVGVGLLFVRGWRAVRPLTERRLLLAVFVLVVILGIRVANIVLPDQFNYSLHTTSSYADSQQVNAIRERVPTEAVVVSPPSYLAYVYMPEFANYLTVDDGEAYGIALRGETYETFWLREQPDVYFGDDPQAYPELWAYMQAQNFQKVMPDLWVRPEIAR